MHLDKLVIFVASMFAITNPLGNLAIFISLTNQRTLKQQRKIALTTGFSVAIILLISIWLGNGLLHFFNIEIYGFEIAGGFLILLISLSMLQAKKAATSHEEDEEIKHKNPKESIAVVPMAIPIMAGPGAMTAAVLAGQKYATIGGKLCLSGGCLVIAGIITIVLLFAAFIARILGEEGLKIFTRIMGLILLSIAFDFIISGISTAFPGLS